MERQKLHCRLAHHLITYRRCVKVGEPAAAAALQAGLRPRALSRPELLQFARRTQVYLEARNAILLAWAANPATFLTADACVGERSHKVLVSEVVYARSWSLFVVHE